MQKLIIWFILLLCILSCNKDNEFNHPLVFTGDVVNTGGFINIDINSAAFTAKILNIDKAKITEYGFVWQMHPDLNKENGIILKKSGMPENEIYRLKTNETLIPASTYFVCAYIETDSSIIYGQEKSFSNFKR